ncbi:hypothetical protein N665_0354s0037 [Sinapis alba]|nr:hypothetical protein N665_0354s0037 [Sinapis alba]
MDSNTHSHLYDPNHIPSSGSGLLRFRSAPSSVLAAFVADDDKSGLDSVSLTNTSVSYTATLPPPQPPQPEPSSFMGLPPHYPRQSKGMMNTIGLDQFLNNHHTKPVESNLLRQSSSPAGMFTTQNGYGSVSSLMNYVGEEEDEQSPSSSNELRRHNSLSSRPPSSLGMLSQIPEIVSESSFQYSHWNDPASFIDNLSSLKRETENGESGNRMQLLSHHLSLPKSSSSTASDMVSVDKYMQLQDSVPCKIRAKRGCATHPRSIAERVRRTKISERMRKLQELVPNMDKQTNTADMLDLAVDYIKDLQRQYKILNENRANCKCMNKEKNLI